MSKFLENIWYKEFFKENKLTIEDLKKPFKVNKIIFNDENDRQEQKQLGLNCPYSLSGSKAKKIVSSATLRFKEVFLEQADKLDLASKTRMKIGAFVEEPFIEMIVPDFLLGRDESEKMYWEKMVLVLDKRRYSHPKYPFISVEYDILVYKTNTIQTKEDLIFNPKSDKDYEYLDNKVASGEWVPHMIMDFKNTKNSIEQNTKDYKEQLTLGCYLNPEFKKHSILALINNAEIEYFIQNYDPAYAENILNKYIVYLDELVAPTMKLLEENNDLDLFEYLENNNDVFSSYYEKMSKFGGTSEGIEKEYLDAEEKETALELLEEAIAYKRELELVKLKFDLTVNKIKELNIPMSEAPTIMATNDHGRLTWSKFKRSGTTSFDIKTYENYLQINNLSGNIVLRNEAGEVVEEKELSEFIKKGEDSYTEFPRFTKNASFKEEEKEIKDMYS